MEGVTALIEVNPRAGSGRPTDGVVIVDGRAGVVWWSAAMQAQLEAAGLRWTRGLRCCEALGCAANTDGAGGCVMRLALTSPDGLPPRPWRLGGGLEGTLAARRLDSGGDLVAFELRLAPTSDFEPRLDAAELRVAALGPLSVRVGDRVLDGDWLQQRPGQVLRYLLAARSGPRRSEVIAAALWPERGPSAVANVRYCIFKLREQLDAGADAAESLIVRDAAGYRIDPRRLRLDVDDFQSRAAAGLAAHRHGDHGSAEELLTAALALYRGEFLAEDLYADWAFTEREYLRSLAGKGLAAMAQIALGSGRLVPAGDHLLRLAQLEPFDSRVHQMLIEVCLRRGRRTEALRHYRALRARLERAFGEQPEFDLATVAAALTSARPELTLADIRG